MDSCSSSCSCSSSLAPVSNGNATTSSTTTATNSSNKEKVWERPWSIAELRDSSRNWTLASDAGVSVIIIIIIITSQMCEQLETCVSL